MKQCERHGTDQGACVRPEGHEPPCSPALTPEQHEEAAQRELDTFSELFRRANGGH